MDSRILSRNVARGGILSALILMAIGASALLPTADLALFSLTSLGMAVAVIELDQRRAWVVFLAVAALTLIWPGWLLSYPFWTFFGIFPILKAVCENRLTRPQARLAKQTAANILLAAAAVLVILVLRLDLLPAWLDQAAWWLWLLAFLALQAAILVYDYALSVMITFYLSRLHGRFR